MERPPKAPDMPSQPEKPKKYELIYSGSWGGSHAPGDYLAARHYLEEKDNQNRDTHVLERELGNMHHLLMQTADNMVRFGDQKELGAELHKKFEELENKYRALTEREQGSVVLYKFESIESAIECLSRIMRLLDEYTNIGDETESVYQELYHPKPRMKPKPEPVPEKPRKRMIDTLQDMIDKRGKTDK